MYSCSKALLLRRGTNQRYIEAIVNDSSVRELATLYVSAYLMIHHPALTEPKALLLSDVHDLVFDLLPTATVDDWLGSLGDTALPLRDDFPVAYGSIVRSNDAFAAGYSLMLKHPIASIDSGLPPSELTDVLLTRDNTDYQECFNYLLPTVNGLLHMTDASSEGFVIKDGGRSVQHANRNAVGLLSFSKVGKLKLIPITDDMIYGRELSQLRLGFRIKLPESIGNRVVMLSIGGVLHYQSQYYRVVGDDLISLDWWKIPLAQRYYNTRHLIDLSAFDACLDRPDTHGDALDLEKANSDEAIRAYMTLSQSFVILLEADNFYVERQALESSGLPGMYYCYEEAHLPIQTEVGLLPSYTYVENESKRAVIIADPILKQYHFETVPESDGTYRTGGERTDVRNRYVSAYFLEMGAERLTQS